MTETIYIGSDAGTRFALAFFAAFCAALGYVIYSLLARPETRRADFITLGAASRRTSLLIAIAASGALFAVICKAMLTGFSRIDVEGEALRLHYVLPRHSVVIRRDQLTLLEKQYAYKISWRLALTTSDLRTFESQPASGAAIEQARLRLMQLAAE
jgi:hypothetical protein